MENTCTTCEFSIKTKYFSCPSIVAPVHLWKCGKFSTKEKSLYDGKFYEVKTVTCEDARENEKMCGAAGKFHKHCGRDKLSILSGYFHIAVIAIVLTILSLFFINLTWR